MARESILIRTLRTRAGRCPGAIALDGERRLSWRVLLADVERCARELHALDTPVVAWQLEDDWRWVVLDLACLVAGKVALPIPSFFTPDQRERALAAAGCRWLIVAAADAAVGASVRRLRWLDVAALPRVGAGAGAPIPAGTAKITFTSGSTGTPRGVCLSRSLLERVAAGLNARLQALGNEPHLSTLPLAVLLENVGGLYRCLLAGGRYILPSPDQRCITGSSSFDDRRLAAAVAAHAPRMLIATPLMLERMAGSPHRQAFRRLRFVAVGGAPLPQRLLHGARARGIAAYEGYGLSECGSVVALNVPGDDRPGTVGRPLPHLSVAAADGQLQVSGGGFLGYLGEAPRPPGPVATGDLGHVTDSGHVRVDGRLDNRIVTPMGRNVSPEWVEAELAVTLPGIKLCVHGDPHGLTALVAGPASATAVTAGLLAANARLPDYARVDHWIDTADVFSVDNGCLTANGRLRRRAIHARFADCPRRPLPGSAHPVPAGRDRPPRPREAGLLRESEA